MNIYVTVDENWAIGSKDGQIGRIPNNQRNFQNITAGSTIIMGRKALAEMPQGMPLMNRDNIVLTKDKNFHVSGAKLVHSMEELLSEMEKLPSDRIFVNGGASVYKQLFPYCNTVYVTMLEQTYPSDFYFENLDKNKDWVMTEESDEQTYFDMTYYFRKYEKKKK